MILTDTGPLVALLDSDDRFHDDCVKVVENLPRQPLLTTWPCFTEAMYLLGHTGGHRFQVPLWGLRADGKLILHNLTDMEVERAASLMAKFHDTPMDLADASLVAVAESLSLRRIFTIDSDFYVYRLSDGTALETIPGVDR